MYKRLLLFVGIAFLAVLLWSLAGNGTKTTYVEAQKVVEFRRIGHELLLSAGDPSSRVMPIEKVSNNEFRVEFENPVAFTPDSLVSVVSRVLNPLTLHLNYIVNAIDLKTKEVVYSFAWPAKKEDIPCMGRALPAGRYAIDILLSTRSATVNQSDSNIIPVTAASLLAACLALLAWRFTRRKNVTEPSLATNTVNSSFIPVGKFRFYPTQHLLVFDQNSIELTAKETKLLSIFSGSPNEVIDRNQLLKEGWEDEGVITGRSLDMYVSKLRKKLQTDPTVSIINVHGKGYRLNC